VISDLSESAGISEELAQAADTPTGSGGFTLLWPMRGRLKVKAKTAAGLTPSEDQRRIESNRSGIL